ncbi:hypothetical protein CN980_25430 [Bacillus cereus]|uniref:Crystaline entomocidal protoxin n=1 Tax=Bacillus cereus TaxID=1396 RepID=A0A9X7C7E7_BACCE|nr:insecticidal delta-endotoxin Cry8Ea1 family protein [Bacillus cereus]PGO64238.1 hypothetical protein CN980_25430 [Bacillus cereus]
MYQNYNYKEYEILGIGGRDYQPRYPLAQAPNAELQQMSYKDWMNRCAGVESGELFDADAVKTMLLIGTGISWAILGVAFPPLSVAVGILNVMISYLWPSQATEDQFSWKQMMSATEQLINQAINPIIKSKAIDALRDLHSSLRDYNQALCNLQTNLDSPDVERYKEVVRREFNDANDKAKSTIINLESDGFQIQFLSSYAQAANIHLLLLKDVKQYGEIWGLTALEVEQYFDNPPSKPGNPGMIQLIEIYTDYCINWYNRGLQQQAETYYWNGFNDFRRTMTIVVLDIVALWPTYNPINYPKPVKAQLTRTVYTPTFGQHIASSKVLFDELELSLVTPPQLFTFLDAVTFYRRDDELTQYAGIMQTLRYTSSLSLFQTIQGQRTDLVDNIRIYSGVLDEVWKTASVVGELDNTSSMNIQTFSFYLLSNPENPVTIGHVYSSNTTAATYGFPCVATNISCIGEPCTPCSISQPLESICNIPNKASHLLVSVTANVQNHIRLSSYGWNHLSADANNLLDAEKITQIPAVKGVRMLSNVSVVKGPGSTGGDLVKMSNGDGVFSISITSPATNERVSGYAIRLRYASNADTNFQIFMATKGQPMIVSDQIIPSTSFDNSLTYQAFDYYTLSEFELKTLPEVKQDTFFDFFKRGAGDILIDKIEFIPIEGSLEEYKANQALEKARKAVNTLFTSDAKTVLKLNVTDYAVD